MWRRLGAEVLVVEFTDRILPLMDQELSGLLHRSLEKSGMKFMFNAAAQKAEIKGDKVQVTIKVGDKVTVEEADRVMVDDRPQAVDGRLRLGRGGCRNGQARFRAGQFAL